jgi:hypothetical protein
VSIFGDDGPHNLRQKGAFPSREDFHLMFSLSPERKRGYLRALAGSEYPWNAVGGFASEAAFLTEALRILREVEEVTVGCIYVADIVELALLHSEGLIKDVGRPGYILFYQQGWRD